MLKIYSISLGCPKNRVDTERALGSLGDSISVTNPEDADLVFINTCGFITPAIEESVRTIVEHIDMLQNLSKRPFLAIAGCLVGRFGKDALAPDLPEVDLFLDIESLEDWGDILCKQLGLTPVPNNRLLSTQSYAWLKISDGCKHNCAFCTIPQIRGALRSTEASILVQEAQRAINTGAKELILVAQDLTAYGNDLNQPRALIDLLDKLLLTDGLERLRLMYLYPAGITKELLSFLQGAGPKFVPYFDVPVQHASSEVLSRMGRPFARDPRKSLDLIREFFPEAALRTSIIVGFPGETTKDFEELSEFIANVWFHHLGVFAYEQEEGTLAAEMAEQIPEEEKEVRKNHIMQIQSEISEEILEEYLGHELEILVDAPNEDWEGLYTGRTWFQAPESDGVTYISGKNISVGALVKADIVETSTYDLVALGEPED